MINPLWLRSFCTLLEQEHFTRTAERLHMTQSGVSQHLRKLEEHLGVTLLERSGKQFVVTDAGKRAYADAKPIVSALESMAQRVANDPPDAGLVRVVSPGSLGLTFYPKLLRLQQQHPALVIDYRFAPNDAVHQAVADDAADIGFATDTSSDERLSYQRIAQESLLLVTPADVEKPDWRVLNELGFIDHPDGAHHAELLLRPNFTEFESIHSLPKTGFSNQIALILEPVALGLGFTVLPAHSVKAFHRQRAIRKHELTEAVSEPLYQVCRSGWPMPNRVSTVCDEALRLLAGN